MSPNTGHMGNKNAYTTDPTKIKQRVNEGNRAGCSIDFYLKQCSDGQSVGSEYFCIKNLDMILPG